MSEQDQQAAAQQLPRNDADTTAVSAKRALSSAHKALSTSSLSPLQESDIAASKLPHNAPHSAIPGRPKPSLSSRLSLMEKSNTGMNTSTRTGLHDKLRAYESRRRLAYAAKFESSSLYWKSFRDLLAASIHETGRAQRLVLGTSRAHKLYSDALQAMYEDVFLDDKGNVMLKANQQKKLAQVRKKPEATKTNGSSGSVLTSVRQAQHVMAERLGENANNMDVEIAEEIGRLLDDLKEKFTGMEKLGDAILGELERTDQEVADAWGSYYTVATENPSTGYSSALPHTKTGAPQETAPNSANASDVWLFQTKYRVAVAYQNVAWEIGSAELSKLFQRMKDEECRRRTSLRELLVAFAQRQQRLFLSFRAIQNPLLEQLVERQIDPKQIEESIQAAIGVGRITGESDGQGLEKSSSEEESDFTLESPLTSDLICKAKVVERQHVGVLKGWKASLAIITSDSYLHFFDLPPERVEQGLEPDVAFQSLVPVVIIPTLENLTLGKSNFSKGWGDSISPSESIVLGNCVIQPRGDSSFEIIETVATTGASKMFGKSVSRKMILRTPSKMETDEWINTLKSPLA